MRDSYCNDPAAAQKATGLSQQDAEAQNEATFTSFAARGAKPTATDRRKLAFILLTANKRRSASVQWLRLAPRPIGSPPTGSIPTKLNRSIEKARSSTKAIISRQCSPLGSGSIGCFWSTITPAMAPCSTPARNMKPRSRRTSAVLPRIRGSSIISGASKSWYDGWTRQMSGVEVVPLAPLLR